MNLIAIVFWLLVLVTGLMALRWGAMIGLVGFILALMIGAVAVSRLSPPKSGAYAARHLALETHWRFQPSYIFNRKVHDSGRIGG